MLFCGFRRLSVVVCSEELVREYLAYLSLNIVKSREKDRAQNAKYTSDVRKMCLCSKCTKPTYAQDRDINNGVFFHT